MKVEEEVALIMSLLGELNYRAEQLDRNRIKVVQGGIAATIMVYSDPSLSLRCLVDGQGEFLFELGRVNDANIGMRFGKFSTLHDALQLECDFVFDPAAPDARDQLGRIMRIWDANMAKLRDLVAGSRQFA